MMITSVGRSALWIGFLGMFLPSMYFAASIVDLMKRKRGYYFETLTLLITSIASVAYLTMATDQGFEGGNHRRQFFYARYVDWTVTTPLMLLDIAGLAGASSDRTLLIVGSDVLMVVAGLIGANMNENEGAETNEYKWAFFGLGMMFFLPIVQFLCEIGSYGSEIPSPSMSLARRVGSLTLVLWSAYPVVWVVAEGLEIIHPDTECIAYAILDICAKSVFGFMIVTARDAMDEDKWPVGLDKTEGEQRGLLSTAQENKE